MSGMKEFDDLAQSFDRIAKQAPKNTLPKAVRQGAKLVQSAIKSAAPKKSGTLRSGLILHKERSRSREKVVYDVMPDPKMNTIFQKPIQNPVRSTSPKGYYPASQEYGFFTRRSDGGMTYNLSNGELIDLDKVPGKYYMRSGAEVTGEAAKEAIVGSLMGDIEKELSG